MNQSNGSTHSGFPLAGLQNLEQVVATPTSPISSKPREYDTTCSHSITSILGLAVMQEINVTHQADGQLLRSESGKPIRMQINEAKRNGVPFPKHVTDELTTWLCDNAMNPYPTNVKKSEIAEKHCLTTTQVNNWFTNARMRNKTYLKHKEEMQKRLNSNTAPLKNWLHRNHANPYPTKQDKMALTSVSGISMTQISTWFANARRRMKKELNLFPYQKLASESISSDSGRDSVKFGDNSPNEMNSTSNLSFSAASSTSDNSTPNSPKAVGISSYEVNKTTETVIQNLSIPVDWQAQISVQVENEYVDVVSPMKESPFAMQSPIVNALQSPTTTVQQTHILVEKPKNKIWSVSDML